MQAPSAKVTVSHPIELLLERPCGRLCMRTIKLDLNLPANEMVHLAAQLVKTQAQLEYLHIRTGDHHSTGRLVLDKLLEAIVFADNALTHLIVDGASVYKPHLLAKVIIDRRVSVLLINVAVATTVIRGSPSANGAAACEAPSVLTVSKMTEVVALQELIVDPIDPLNCWEGTPKSGLNLSYVTFSPVSATPVDARCLPSCESDTRYVTGRELDPNLARRVRFASHANVRVDGGRLRSGLQQAKSSRLSSIDATSHSFLP